MKKAQCRYCKAAFTGGGNIISIPARIVCKDVDEMTLRLQTKMPEDVCHECVDIIHKHMRRGFGAIFTAGIKYDLQDRRKIGEDAK